MISCTDHGRDRMAQSDSANIADASTVELNNGSGASNGRGRSDDRAGMGATPGPAPRDPFVRWMFRPFPGAC